MKLSRNTIVGMAVALTAIVLVVTVSSRPVQDRTGAAGDRAGESEVNFSGAKQDSPQRVAAKPESTSPGALAARELEVLWASGRFQELLIHLDRVSANNDPEYWREVAPLLAKQAAKESRSEIVNYLLATSDAAPDDNLRIEIYASALDNRDKGIQSTARLELENITGEDFADGNMARKWLAANPQPVRDKGISEDQ